MEIEKVQLQNQVFSKAIEDAIFIIQGDEITYSNDAARVLFNFEGEHFPRPIDLVPPDSLATFNNCLQSSVAHFEQMNMMDRNGDTFLCDLYKVQLESDLICLVYQRYLQSFLRYLTARTHQY